MFPVSSKTYPSASGRTVMRSTRLLRIFGRLSAPLRIIQSRVEVGDLVAIEVGETRVKARRRSGGGRC
jgi:hypothetical protein